MKESVTCKQCRNIFLPKNYKKSVFCSRSCRTKFFNGNGINNGIVKFCPTCGLTRPVAEFFKNSRRSDGLSAKCWECHCQESKKTLDTVKTAAFNKLGNKCNCCKFDRDARAFQIDHVNGDGSTDRCSAYTLYKKIISDKTGRYQILCANCNVIKRIENKESRQTSKSRRLE